MFIPLISHCWSNGSFVFLMTSETSIEESLRAYACLLLNAHQIGFLNTISCSFFAERLPNPSTPIRLTLFYMLQLLEWSWGWMAIDF